MARIHIIYPDIGSGYYPNLNHGIAFLVGSLRKNSHFVSFHHITSPESTEQVVLQTLCNEPDVVGFSLCHNQSYLAEQYVRAIRKVRENIFLIAGGIFPTTDPNEAFKHLDVDAVAIGEAEYNLVNLMNAIPQGREAVYQTEGFYFRIPNGEVVKRKIPPLNPDLSKLPWPDYSIFDVNRVLKESGGWLTMILSRGCPFNCTYCCNSVLMNLYPDSKDYFRRPSVEHAIRLIKHNLTYAIGVKGISFDDDLLCQDKKWFLDFSRLYNHEIGLPYTMNARIETLNEDIIHALKNSGCRIVNVGVESGNEWVRKNLLNRNYSNTQMEAAFSSLRAAGILTSSYNMIGLPFETRDQMLDTLRINKKLRPYRGACFYFFPYPKTRLYEICREFHLLRADYEKLRGYFGSPGIILTHCRPKDARRICDRLRLLLHLNRILTNIRLRYIGSLLYYCMIPFASYISRLLVGSSGLKSMIRAFVYRTVPSSIANEKQKEGKIQ